MIIDKILDRKDDIEIYNFDSYNAHDFYFDCLGYSQVFDQAFDYITIAMDYGTEEDVKKALCKYIDDNDYNPKIKDFIKSVEWLKN